MHIRYRPDRALRWFVALAVATAVAVAPGCLKLSSRPPAPPPPPVAPPVRPAPKPQPVAVKTEAYDSFVQLRKDFLEQYPHLGKVNCVFAVGVDVSGSSHANGILEYTTKMLSDACRYFFCPGDRIIIIPWDSRIRSKHVKSFDIVDNESAVDELNAAFEDLENLVDPESRGSNLLDARGVAMEQCLKAREETGGTLHPAVLIFTDIRVPDMSFAKQEYTPARLGQLRKKLAGEAEFEVRAYQAREKRQVVAHMLGGQATESAAVASVNRMRSAGTTTVRPPASPPPAPAPRKPRDLSSFRALLIVLVLLCLGALVALPFAWTHRLSLGDVRGNIKAFGGRVKVQSGRGISPPGVVYLPVPDLDDRPLFAIEGRGPQVVAKAQPGVRLNDGQTELAVPVGRPVQLRISVQGAPGEQYMDVHVADFFATNTGPIIGMIVAFIVLIAAIIG